MREYETNKYITINGKLYVTVGHLQRTELKMYVRKCVTFKMLKRLGTNRYK